MVYKVRTTVETKRGVAGSDTCIIRIPDLIYRRVDGGPPVILVAVLGRLIREVSTVEATKIGEVLHHADWIITGDPARVREISSHHAGCVTCTAMGDQALAYLADHPGSELLCGRLYWAG